MTNVIRNVFSRIGHVLETNLVDPKEEYQAVLLGDPLGQDRYQGDYSLRGKLRTPREVGDDRATHRLNKAA